MNNSVPLPTPITNEWQPAAPRLQAVPAPPPQTLSHGVTAGAIVIRAPRPPKDDAPWSWWTPDALDDEEWSPDHGWYQIGFELVRAVHLQAEPGTDNRPRDKPKEFFWNMSKKLARHHDGGQVLEQFKNPFVQHLYPIHTPPQRAQFSLGEIRDMVESQQERARMGGMAKTPKKSEAARTNLAGARAVKSDAAAERYAEILTYLDAGVTVAQIAQAHGLSFEAAKKFCQRAKKWRAEQ